MSGINAVSGQVRESNGEAIKPRTVSGFAQLGILVRRYTTLIMNDVQRLALIFGQPLIIGLLLTLVLSAIFVHVIFTAFTIVLCWCNGYIPSVYLLQIIYYMICNFLLVLGLAYFTSAVVVFFRDLTQIVNIVLQIGMWMTPIMWNISDILVNHPTLAKVFKLNPMYYIVDGFRNALLDHIWFWEKPLWTLAFWIITLLFFVIGVNVFNRLKVHFADVL